MPNVRVCIVGAGMVGATCAYAITLNNVASEILLTVVDEKKLEGEVSSPH